jgi:hypothetical protein
MCSSLFTEFEVASSSLDSGLSEPFDSQEDISMEQDEGERSVLTVLGTEAVAQADEGGEGAVTMDA